MKSTRLQIYDCDRCGLTYKKHELRRQRGMMLCESCRDDYSKINHPRPRFFTPRSNSTSVTSVNEPTIFPISAATGIDRITQSRVYTREGGRSVYHMYIVGNGGPINITADPQIIDGLQGDVLTLTGTSNTNTVTIEDAGDLALTHGSMILGDGDSITFVYNKDYTIIMGGLGWGLSEWGSTGYGWGSTNEAWVETSRTKGGF